MPNPAAWFGQGEPDTQSVAVFVDPTTGAQLVVNTSQGLPVATGVPLVNTIVAGTSATGAGTALDGAVPHSTHTLVVLTSAGVASGVVTLQLSLDNTNWFSFATTITTNAATTVFSQTATGAFRYVRANITTIIGGGTITAWVASA